MSSLYLYLDTPVVIFKGRVNLASASYPLTSIPFDTVTVGAYTAIETDMTLLLGSTDGADDLGRCRIQNVATSTAIPVGRISQGYEDGQLTATDNAYITVWRDYRVWSKPPYIVDKKTQYKDSDITVGTYTSTGIPPVANCGPGFAATIASSIITAFFDGTASFAVADGASISTYAWDVKDGTITIGSSSTSQITATFPAGFRWVALTVTDSNGLTHTARCPVLAVNPASDVRISDFNATFHITPTGQTAQVVIKQAIPQSSYPDGCLVMLWQGEPVAANDRSHMRLIGWHQSDESDVRATRTGNVRDVTFNVVDVAGRLASLPGFSQVIEAKATPANWSEMLAPTMDKYIHYLLLWHSTALAVADYIPSGTGSSYPFVTFHSEGENLFDQVNDQAKRLLPDHLFTCNLQGQLAVTPDPMLRNASDRTVLTVGTFTEEYTQEIRFTYTRPPKKHWVRGHAMLTQSDYTNVDGVDTLLTVHCIAPGTAPGQGVDELETTEGLVPSQAILNAVTGHRYARLNSRYSQVTITPADDTGFETIDPAKLQWLPFSVTAATAAQRGLTFTNVRTLCQEISRRYEARRTGTIQSATYTLEIETVGTPATTVIPTGSTAVVPDPIPAPDMGLISGQALVAGIGKFKVYRTSDFTTPSGSGGPTWDAVDLTGADEILTWVVDPFSPGYIDGAGSIDGWLATATKLYRVTNLFGTPSVSTQITFAKTATWRTVQASFGTYFFSGLNPWLICVSYYGSTSGHTGTWATYSVDGGATWAAEVQISAFYDSGSPVNPIGLYTSPKTPGLAYTVAHTATANPGVTSGYVSHDYGATWTQMTASVNPATPMPVIAKVHGGATDWGILAVGPSASYTASTTGVGGSDDLYVVVCPPKDAIRCNVHVVWTASYTKTGSGSGGVTMELHQKTGVTRTDDKDFSAPAANSTTSGAYDVVWTYANTPTPDWPTPNAEGIQAALPVSGPTGCEVRGLCLTTSSNVTVSVTISVTVTEIELDDHSVYTPISDLIAPIHGSAGEIHVPWEGNDDESVIYYGALDRTSNRLFALMRVTAGTGADISPNDGTRDYGANAGQFAIRAFDSDRQYMLAAVTGNDTSGSTSGDKRGIYKSSNAGTAWTNIVAPSTGTEVYQAAFGGDDHNILYLWGPAGYMGYSSNFGTSIDSRAGNLGALSATKLIGLAGGPTP